MKLSEFMKQLQPWLDRYGDDCEIFISGAWSVREPLIGGVGSTAFLSKGKIVSWKRSDPYLSDFGLTQFEAVEDASEMVDSSE